MSRKVAVILSGCGVYDGAEIHEAVCALLALNRAGATAVCAAPNVEFDEIDHITSQPTGKRRNALVEAARIARGQIRDVALLHADEFDAALLPGGAGAAKNLSNFATAGADCTVLNASGFEYGAHGTTCDHTGTMSSGFDQHFTGVVFAVRFVRNGSVEHRHFDQVFLSVFYGF